MRGGLTERDMQSGIIEAANVGAGSWLTSTTHAAR